LNGGSLLLLDNPDFIVMEIEVFEITDWKENQVCTLWQ
jgi:hypothetical protein